LATGWLAARPGWLAARPGWPWAGPNKTKCQCELDQLQVQTHQVQVRSSEPDLPRPGLSNKQTNEKLSRVSSIRLSIAQPITAGKKHLGRMQRALVLASRCQHHPYLARYLSSSRHMHPISSSIGNAVDHFDDAVDKYVGQRLGSPESLALAIRSDSTLIIAHALKLAIRTLDYELDVDSANAAISEIRGFKTGSTSARERAIATGEYSHRCLSVAHPWVIWSPHFGYPLQPRVLLPPDAGGMLRVFWNANSWLAWAGSEWVQTRMRSSVASCMTYMRISATSPTSEEALLVCFR
jgi:hypothetical protein